MGRFRRLNTVVSASISVPRAGCNIPTCCVLTSSRTSSGLRHCSKVHCNFQTPSTGALRRICIGSQARNFNSRIGHQVVLKAFSLSTNFCSTCFGGTTGVQALVTRSFTGILGSRSLVVKPANTGPTFRVNSRVTSPGAVCVGSVLAIPIGVTNLPTVSLPTNFSGNLPINLRVVNGTFSRRAVCGTNCIFRRAASFRGRVPGLKNRSWSRL